MPILNITSSQAGLTGVSPALAYIQTTDTETEVLATGYLNQAVQSGLYTFSLPCMCLVSTTATGTAPYSTGWYNLSYVSGNWSLTATTSPGDIVLPTTVNHIATYTDVDGTLSEDPATAISGGNIQAGLSGTAGSLYSYPATASKGHLALTAVANTGNTVTVLSNDAMGQASTVNIPDPGNAVGQLLIGATATPFVNGNFPKNSGTVGLMIDSGIAVAELMQLNAANTLTGSGQIILAKANGTESSNAVTASGNAGVITTSSLTTAGGSSYAITWTNTLITSSSVILLTIMGGTNTTENVTLKATAGSGSSTLTIYNNTSATALNGTILIGYAVF